MFDATAGVAHTECYSCGMPAEPLRDSRVLAGTVVVAVVLSASRWGTNVGIAPFFISDVLIALCLAHLLVSRTIRRGYLADSHSNAKVTAIFVMFFGYFLLRFFASFGQQTLLDWLRDGVPFAYGLLAFVSAYSLNNSSREARARTARVLRWALTIHMLWVSIVVFTGNAQGIDILGPLGSSPVFQVRPDIDVAILSIAAALCLRQLILGRRRLWNLLGLGLALFTAFAGTATRAGQISLVIAIAAVFALMFASSRQASGRRLFLLFVIPFAIAGALIVIPTTQAGQRLIATITPSSSSSSESALNAEGTQRARELVWTGVIKWTNENPVREIVGSGFGNDFLTESGTIGYLEGTTYNNVRSPHNWFVGIYARMGLIGLALSVVWLMTLLWGIFSMRERIGSDDLFTLAAVTVIALIPVASLGVVLEAPFGAIPFFWAAGLLMASRAKSEPHVAIDRKQNLLASR